MSRFICHAAVSAALLVAHRVWAGGSGLNVIVVVNQNSTNSVQLGNDYCEQRGEDNSMANESVHQIF